MVDNVFYREHDEAEVFEIRPWNIGAVRSEQYPSEWFTNNPNNKPTLLLVADRITNALRSHICQGILNNTIRPEIAVAFIYDEFCKVPGTLIQDWSSFGREIGKKGTPISLANLVRLDENETFPPIPNVQILPDNFKPLPYLTYIACVYRLYLTSNEKHRTDLIANMTKVLASLELTKINLSTAYSNCNTWASYLPLNRIMAFVDMFLTEFPLHPYAKVRLGSIVTRFKDCSVLLAIPQLMKSLELNFSTFACWLWHSTISTQFRKMVESPHEMDNSRSYAAYFMELGLSMKSPYSATLNPDLHLFVHIVGSLLHIERSKNAKMIGVPNVTGLVTNAKIMYLALRKGGDLKIYFSMKNQSFAKADEADAKEINPEDPPSSIDPLEWFKYLSAINFQIPQSMEQDIRNQVLQFGTVRDGTVADFLIKTSVAMHD